MTDKIILLSDHTWFAVCDREQAQRFVNTHFCGDVPFAYGIYIEVDNKNQTILYKEEER